MPAVSGRPPGGVRVTGVRLPVGVVGLDTLGLLVVGKTSPASSMFGKAKTPCWNPGSLGPREHNSAKEAVRLSMAVSLIFHKTKDNKV